MDRRYQTNSDLERRKLEMNAENCRKPTFKNVQRWVKKEEDEEEEKEIPER